MNQKASFPYTAEQVKQNTSQLIFNRGDHWFSKQRPDWNVYCNICLKNLGVNPYVYRWHQQGINDLGSPIHICKTCHDILSE